jgi:hypothetical protein
VATERPVADPDVAVIRYGVCYKGKDPRGDGHASRQTEAAMGGKCAHSM